MDDATAYFPSGTTYQWAMWTGDIILSNMFDEISHAEILIAVAWALNNVASWSGRRSVDRFSVARHSKAARIGADYTDGEYDIVMITSLQLFDICDLMQLYVNVRHRYYKRGLGAPMGGMLSAFYAILVCSRREAMVFKPRLTELALPMVTCCYMDDVFLAFSWQDNEHLERATEVAKYIAAEGTGYPHPLVLGPEGTQRFLELQWHQWVPR